jgi:hypothetical protein
MVDGRHVEYWSSIIQILIDLSNLSEQLAIYFIVKQESNDDKYQQRLFFFVLLAIGFLSCIFSAISQPYLKIIGSISIELGELSACLFLLKRSNKIVLVAFIFFGFEFALYSIIMILEYLSTERKVKAAFFGNSVCGRVKYIGMHLLMYCLFDATSIFFLFLDDNSRFHQTFYEILILLTFYCPNIALDPALESTARFKYEYEHGCVPRITIPLVWSLFCVTLYFLMYYVPLSITGIVFAVQELQETNQQHGYDFAVYITALVFFSIGIFVSLPFMSWRWRSAIHKLMTMRVNAERNSQKLNQPDYTYLCLSTSG